jgi:tRNA (guanine-N7-)-methyltransferase
MSSELCGAADESVSPASPSLIHRPFSYVENLDMAQLFSKIQPLEIELGSGDGSFLVQYAQLYPQHNFLGVERLLGRLRKLDRKGLRARLTNLRLIRLEASYLIEYLVPRESALALHIYFPDPWPKRRHRKHRLINQQFTSSAQHVLRCGGIVYLRTDDADSFAQMTTVFGGNPAFRPVPTPGVLAGIATDFERDFHVRRVPILQAAYQRVS